MSTIEKALDKLGKSHDKAEAAGFIGVAGQDIPGGQVATDTAVASMQKRVAKTSRRHDLDIERLTQAGFLMPEAGRTQLAEEMRHIKRPLLLNTQGPAKGPFDTNLIMVTSSKPSEGKSYTSLNLAMSIAKERDKTVLLIDADVAKPGVTRLLAMESEKGLVDYLEDDKLDLADVMLKTNVPNFRFVPAGQRHIHSTELLASKNMMSLAKELSERYPDRIVIFDSPPLLATSEAAVVAGLVGQIVMIVEAEKTTRQELEEALALIDQTDKYVGLVLNKVRRTVGTDYYGYYGAYSD